MKNKKSQFLILGGVILALAGYLILNRSDRMNYTLPDIPAMDAAALSKIEIIKKDNTLTLIKKDNKWLIAPNNYPTDETRIKSITDAVEKLTLTELASKTKNYVLYGLDEPSAITVKAYEKEKAAREFIIGKVTASYNHTFVRLPGDEQVYHALDAFRDAFEKDVDELRDKTALKIESAAVSEITIEKDGQVFPFTRAAKKEEAPAPAAGAAPQPTAPPADKSQPVWNTKDGKEANATEIDAILSQLTDLKGENYVPDRGKEAFLNPLYTLKIKAQKDYTLSIYPQEDVKDKGSDTPVKKYAAISSENPYPFYLSTYQAEQIMKKPEDLVKKETAAPGDK